MQMKKIYSELDYLAGTRFHSVIFSLASLVPSVAITYGGNKGDGIMQDFNLSEYAIPIDRIDGNLLIGKFQSLIKNEDEVKKIIKESVTSISNQVDEIVNLIK